MEIKSTVIFLLAILFCDVTGNSERILSRRRRYLTFPTGSSLQLGTVYPKY